MTTIRLNKSPQAFAAALDKLSEAEREKVLTDVQTTGEGWIRMAADGSMRRVTADERRLFVPISFGVHQ